MDKSKFFYLLYGIVACIFVVLIYFQARNWDPDLWMHLKAGEVIANNGIIYKDLITQAGPNREWLPHEWLFQLFIYKYVSFFGLGAIPFFVTSFMLLQITILVFILRKLFKLSHLFCFLIAILYFLANFNVFVPRPQIITFSFLFLNLYLILNYVINKKNKLLLTLPISYIWANMHSSVLFNTIIFGLFSISLFIYWILNKNSESKRQAIIVCLTAVGNFVVSILPPLFLVPYIYVLRFFVDYQYSKELIAEWHPLTQFIADSILYTVIVLLVCGFNVYVLYRIKDWKKIFQIAPLYLFIIVGYSALRQVLVGYLVLSIILGWSLLNIKESFSKTFKNLALGVIVLAIAAHSWLLYIRFTSPYFDYPERAVNFLKQEDIKGNMFNEYSVGSYLAYYLYPEKKVFIDSRADVFLCCEIPNYIRFKNVLNEDEKLGNQALDEMIAKYHFTNFILTVNVNAEGQNIANLLRSKEGWQLIFFDDIDEIYVKKDSGNEDILKKYSFKYATPRGDTPYKDKQSDKALQEYETMNKISPSAISQNAIGQIYFEKGDLSKAKSAFLGALGTNNKLINAYYNLAEVYIRERNASEAIKTYQDDLKIESNDLYAYDRLGQLYFYALQDNNRARAMWLEGLNKAQNDKDKKLFQVQLNKL